MKTFREFLRENMQNDIHTDYDDLQHLKNHINSLYELNSIDISRLGKFLLDKFYDLSLFDNSNLISPVDSGKIVIPGTDRYNFNNTLYYKYNYDRYNFRHPMDLDDVFVLLDRIYAKYGSDDFSIIYKYIDSLEKYNDNDIDNVKNLNERRAR